MTNPQETLKALGVTVESVFVPFSRSRNKDAESPSLNWLVTIKRNGRDVLTTEYGAGQAHCPSYNKKVPGNWNHRASLFRVEAVALECETGIEQDARGFGDSFMPRKIKRDGKTVQAKIEPNAADVLFALVMDSNVLDSGGFENWAGDFGFDTDSRKAETIYKSCLELALAMRAGFGNDGMESLQSAFENY